MPFRTTKRRNKGGNKYKKAKEKAKAAKEAKIEAKAEALRAAWADAAEKTYPAFDDDEWVGVAYCPELKTKGSVIAHYFSAGWAIGEIILVPESKDYYWVKFYEDNTQVCLPPFSPRTSSLTLLRVV